MRTQGPCNRSTSPAHAPGVEVLAIAGEPARSLVCSGTRFELRTWTFSRIADTPARAAQQADREAVILGPDATHIGFVATGTLDLESASGRFDLATGMYFAIPGASRLRAASATRRTACSGFVVSWQGGTGLFHVGGPVESHGRLRYLDGCSDTLLVPPTLRGDPCLNLLYVPASTHQTEHTHPSFRVGFVAAGHGRCCTPEGAHALEPGSVFSIPSGARHHFETSDEALQIIAFHPDSDFGPTDEDHPMWNRTLSVAGERVGYQERPPK